MGWIPASAGMTDKRAWPLFLHRFMMSQSEPRVPSPERHPGALPSSSRRKPGSRADASVVCQTSPSPRAPSPESRVPSPEPRAPSPESRVPSVIPALSPRHPGGSRDPGQTPASSVRLARAPSPESRAPSPEPRAPSPEPRAPSVIPALSPRHPGGSRDPGQTPASSVRLASSPEPRAPSPESRASSRRSPLVIPAEAGIQGRRQRRLSD
jgi:hypothetical protein